MFIWKNVRRKFNLEKSSLIVRIHRQLKLTSWSLRSVALEIEKAKNSKNNSHTMSTGEQIKKLKPLKIQTAKHNHGYSRCFANEWWNLMPEYLFFLLSLTPWISVPTLSTQILVSFFSAHNCNIRFHVNFTQRHLHVSSLAGYFILFFYNGCFDKKNYCMKGRYISAELNPQIFTINFLQLNETRD